MAALHRYCPDHSPDRALCGAVATGELVADEDVDATAETLAFCVVCDDLNEQACQDACLALREATA